MNGLFYLEDVYKRQLYKLSVTIGNASEDIDFVIEDWIPNTLSVGDIFGEPVK